MKHVIGVLFGFILFNAQFGENLNFVLKMDDKSGKTWVLWAEGRQLVWREINQADGEVVEFKRSVPSAYPREQWLQQ